MQCEPGERYDFKRTTRNAVTEYPSVYEGLVATFSDYDLIWDRQRERWVCVRWLSSQRCIPIFILEKEPLGTYADPDMNLIGFLKETFVADQDIEKFCDKLDADYAAFQKKAEAEAAEKKADYMRPYLEYLARNPTSVTSKSKVAGWHPTYLANMQVGLDASRRCQTGE